MEYVQMTLDDWTQMKQKLKQELLGVKQSFVRIGYALRTIDDQKLYERDGYKSIAEFAKAEYGLEASTVSRFISINKEYSVDGYSEHLRPEYMDLSRSQLEEMLKLPEADRVMVQPETPREDIRELKRFNREAPAAGVADDLLQLARNFLSDNQEAAQAVREGRDIKSLKEVMNPSGNRSYRKGIYFLMMYENKILIKKFGVAPTEMTWEEFAELAVKALPAEEKEDPETPEAEQEKTEHAKSLPVNMKNTRTNTEDGKPEPETDLEEGKSEDEKGENGNAEGGTGREEQTVQQAAGEPETVEQAGRTAGKEDEIAPAQKPVLTQEISEKMPLQQSVEKAEKPLTPKQEAEQQTAPKPEKKDAETTPIPKLEAIEETGERRFGNRKEYLDLLTVYEMALYMAQAMEKMEKAKLQQADYWDVWLRQTVDESGESI